MKVELIHGLPCRQQDESIDSWDILLLKDGVPTGGVVMSGTRAFVEQCIAGTQAEVISASMDAAPVGSVPYGEQLPVPETMAPPAVTEPVPVTKLARKTWGKKSKAEPAEPSSDATVAPAAPATETAVAPETTAVAVAEGEPEPYYSAPVARPTKEPKAEFPAVLIDAACDITEFASTDSTRFVLNGVHFTEGYVEATDGRKLIRVPYPSLPIKDFPPMAGVPDTMKPITVPYKAMQEAIRAIPKGLKLPVLNTAKVGMNGGPNVKLGSTNLDSVKVTDSKVVDGQWCNTQQVIPVGAAKFSIALAPEHLMAFCKHAMKHAPEGCSSMKFEFVDDLSPVRITYLVGKKADNRRAFGVLMPMRMS